jgi:L-aspartate oxidase
VTVLASGGVGGLYKNSTNFKHLTGDALAISLKHDIELKDMSYVQIHPTTLYQENPKERSFLISESVRGEGALLYDKNMNRFVDELQPRDVVAQAILKQMKKDGTDHVWEDLRTIPKKELEEHFPNILAHCREAGYDPFTECIPVVPAQHYFMGGIKVNHHSKTTMDALYAVGETACNGVHGQNRLASNSLLESLVFAKRASKDLVAHYETVAKLPESLSELDLEDYQDQESLEEDYKKMVLEKLTEQNQLASYIV